VYAVDIRDAMHDYYRDRGVPHNAGLVTSGVDDLPIDTGCLDAVLSTMTYHEFAGRATLDEVTRVLADAGRLVIVDWAATGSGDHGPPLDERTAAAETATNLREAGFTSCLLPSGRNRPSSPASRGPTSVWLSTTCDHRYGTGVRSPVAQYLTAPRFSVESRRRRGGGVRPSDDCRWSRCSNFFRPLTGD
jgi:SAM-dependent methyltransferase